MTEEKITQDQITVGVDSDTGHVVMKIEHKEITLTVSQYPEVAKILASQIEHAAGQATPVFKSWVKRVKAQLEKENQQ